jgi:hypothetical protein
MSLLLPDEATPIQRASRMAAVGSGALGPRIIVQGTVPTRWKFAKYWFISVSHDVQPIGNSRVPVPLDAAAAAQKMEIHRWFHRLSRKGLDPECGRGR